jgi:ubiquinone/menaquinone biosynthesis C-methylase UbiE
VNTSEKSWREAARRFYDREAAEKASPSRHRLFRKSYGPVAGRLALGPRARLLDAGCGCGELIGSLGKAAPGAVGVDLSPLSLRTARNFHPESAFLGGDLGRLPFRDFQFDAATAITSLEFCRDKAAALAELRRVLRPGGRLYLDVRNADFLLFPLLRPLVPMLQRAGWLSPYPAPEFRDLALEEWRSLLKEAGFRVLAIYPSVWPWNFGSPVTRAKNLLIALIRALSSIRLHYMVGLLAEKA